MSNAAETPQFNQLLPIPSSEIELLWEAGTPTEDALNLKHSPDGQWLLEMHPVPEEDALGMTMAELCDISNQELARLRELGLHIISYAQAPLDAAKKILTITPWIDGLERASQAQYDTHVRPVMLTYYRGWVRDYRQARSYNKRYFFIEDGSGQQFSSVAGTGHPFLHDLDPRFGKSNQLATAIIKSHSAKQNTNKDQADSVEPGQASQS